MDDPTRWCENDTRNGTRLPGSPVPSGGPFYFDEPQHAQMARRPALHGRHNHLRPPLRRHLGGKPYDTRDTARVEGSVGMRSSVPPISIFPVTGIFAARSTCITCVSFRRDASYSRDN